MGLYRAVAKPLFFALPPEGAHSLAQRLLGLPLPWARMGAAERDPRLRVTLGGIELDNPVGLAAGFDKACAHLDALGRLGFGYLVGGTVTREPRRGHAKPRIVRDPPTRSMVNAMGLPNPGLETVARKLRRTMRSAPRIVSLADEATGDALAVLVTLEPLVDGFELNASSPNAMWSHEGSHVAELLREMVPRTHKPIFLKLPRFETDAERENVIAMAVAAKQLGAAGLTCSNTLPVEEPRLARGRGGLSGRPLFARTLEIVREVRRATEGSLPINASGGISTAADVIACIEAGATTVQVYTGLVYEGPRIVGDITRGLAASLRGRGVALAELVGAS